MYILNKFRLIHCLVKIEGQLKRMRISSLSLLPMVNKFQIETFRNFKSKPKCFIYFSRETFLFHFIPFFLLFCFVFNLDTFIEYERKMLLVY